MFTLSWLTRCLGLNTSCSSCKRTLKETSPNCNNTRVTGTQTQKNFIIKSYTTPYVDSVSLPVLLRQHSHLNNNDNPRLDHKLQEYTSVHAGGGLDDMLRYNAMAERAVSKVKTTLLARKGQK